MNLDKYENDELIILRAEVEREMRTRGISYSVGEIGESISIQFFKNTPHLSNLKEAPRGTKNVDAISRNGERYSIKTSQRGHKTGTIYPDGEDPNTQLFEYLLIVVLDDNFKLKELYRFSWQQFLKIRAWDKRMNAWYVPISKTRLENGECLFRKDE